MLENNIPLFSQESYRPLNEFDIVGFSLQHELCYTNVLHMLNIGNIQLKAGKRSEDEPLVIAGGPATFNPEPLTDFIDLFVIGDGEDIINEIIAVYSSWSKKGKKSGKKGLLQELGSIQGIYIPSFYTL